MKETGNEVSYNGGKFQLICYADGTPNAVKIRPIIKVSTAFNAKHTYKVEMQPLGTDLWFTVADSTKLGSSNPSKYVEKGWHGTFYPLGILSGYNSNSYFSINANYKFKVRAIIGGSKASTVTITSDEKPAQPTITKVDYLNDGHFDVTIQVNSKGTAVPNNTLHLYYKTDIDEASWSEIGSGTSLGGSTDVQIRVLKSQDVSNGHRYKFAASVENQAGDSGKKSTSFWSYTLPPNVSDVQAEKGTGSYINVSFNLPSAEIRDRGILTGVKLQRNVNGANRSGVKIWEDVPIYINGEQVTVKPITPTDPTYQVIRDSKVSDDNYYSYRVVSVNSQHIGVDGEPLNGTDNIYMNPLPPSECSGYYRPNGSVYMFFDSESKVATETEIQRSSDGGVTWDDIATVTFQRMNTYVDANPPTNVELWYRFRNTRDESVSAWCSPIRIEPLSIPNPPTLLSPYNGARILRSDNVRLSWMHNPTDNTAQTTADIQVTQNGTLWEVEAHDEMYYDFPMEILSDGAPITWRVRTYGSYDITPSDWSDTYTFFVYQQPSLAINSPSNNTVVEVLPLHFDMDYTDMSGTLASLTMAVRQGQNTLYTVDLPTNNDHIEYDLDYLFENGEAYNIVISALSTSGLSVTKIVPITVAYGYVSFTHPWYPDTEIEEDTGIVTVSISEGQMGMSDDPDDPTTYYNEEVVRAVLYRNTAQGRVKIADTVTLGQQFTDLYAPLNQDYTYELLMVSETGKISVLTQIVHINSKYWYVYWGPNHENICRALWNPQGDVSLKRPEKQLIRYSGREYPVSYDSTAMEETFSYGGIITDRTELNNFIAMIKNGGTGIWHSANGESYDASFDFDYSADYTDISLMWSCKLNVTRINE